MKAPAIAVVAVLILLLGNVDGYKDEQPPDMKYTFAKWIYKTILDDRDYFIPSLCKRLNIENCEKNLEQLGNKLNWRGKSVSAIEGIIKQLPVTVLGEITKGSLNSRIATVAHFLQLSLESMEYKVEGEMVGVIGNVAAGVVNGYDINGTDGAVAGGLIALSYWGIQEMLFTETIASDTKLLE